MTLRVNDLQSGSDLDSIRNSTKLLSSSGLCLSTRRLKRKGVWGLRGAFSWIFIHEYMGWIKQSSNMGNAAEEVPNNKMF